MDTGRELAFDAEGCALIPFDDGDETSLLVSGADAVLEVYTGTEPGHWYLHSRIHARKIGCTSVRMPSLPPSCTARLRIRERAESAPRVFLATKSRPASGPA